jgi:hypothetical protein
LFFLGKVSWKAVFGCSGRSGPPYINFSVRFGTISWIKFCNWGWLQTCWKKIDKKERREKHTQKSKSNNQYCKINSLLSTTSNTFQIHLFLRAVFDSGVREREREKEIKKEDSRKKEKKLIFIKFASTKN